MAPRYQHEDALHKQAKEHGYRSRAAFKLDELQQKFRLIRKGHSVVDLGCAPGGWLQVAAREVGPEGKVVGVDLEQVKALGDAELRGTSGKECCRPIILQGDFLETDIQQQLAASAPGGFDVVLSDLSPKLSGIKDRDQARAVELAEAATTFALNMLKRRGVLVVKIFPGADTDDFIKRIKKLFRGVKRTTLKSSRSSSIEQYLICNGPLQERVN